MSEAIYQWSFNLSYRLVNGENYDKRHNALISALYELGFVENLTSSSMYLWDLELGAFEETVWRVRNILRCQPYSNPADAAIIQEIYNKKGKKDKREIQYRTFILAPNSDIWEEVNEEELYDFLYDLAEKEEKHHQLNHFPAS